MDNTRESDRLQHLYLTGVRPNGKDIGVGAYGRVFEVEFCETVCAAKEVHPILLQEVQPQEFEATKKAFLTECVQSSALGHENVVQVLGVYNPGGLLPVLVMERMQESLTSVVKKYPNIPMYMKLSMLLDVSRGLWYLHAHQPPIVHRDLSPNNVLLTSQFVAKISDLGVAKVIRADSKKTRAPGTVDFMPPEALLETPEYGPPLDIFSYGGVILHVVNQEWPKPLHYVMTDSETGKTTGLSEVERRQQHLEKMTGIPAELRPLVEQCLDNEPSRRPPISDLSKRMKRMKEVESVRCPYVNTNPITWQLAEETTKMLRDASTQTVQQPVADSQVDKVKLTLKWEELAPLPVCRAAHTAVLLGGNVYVGGGLNKKAEGSYRLDVYNLTTNQWSTSPITTPYYHFAMTILDDKLVIAGGATENGDVVKKVLVLNAGQWKDCNEMPTARYSATAVGYHSMLIVVGGLIKVEGGWTRLSTTELLDTTNGCWYTCNSIPSPHSRLKAVIMDDKLYLLGGHGGGEPSADVYFTSLDTLSTHQLNWQSAPSIPWCYSAPIVLYNKFLLAVGGRQQQSRTSEVNVFNQSTGQWKHLTNIPAARSSTAVVGVADNIIVMGGSINDKLVDTVWIGVFEKYFHL